MTVLGVIENMSGFACPRCGDVSPILRAGGTDREDDLKFASGET